MRNLLRVAPAGIIVVLVASAALAQPPFRGGMFRGNPAMLLQQESVQKDLKLSDSQVKKVQELGEKMREKFEELRDLEPEERGKKMRELTAENDKAIANILKPEQEKRLHQIAYQQQGPDAFSNPQVVKALGLNDTQKAEIQKINEDFRSERRELFQGGPPDEETRKKMRELEKTASDKIMKVLTSEQKTKWKEMEGEPFKGEIRFGPPR
jgi:eukaryotic-like serine/threonine-protein kinase